VMDADGRRPRRFGTATVWSGPGAIGTGTGEPPARALAESVMVGRYMS
jgi:hypothetical protein